MEAEITAEAEVRNIRAAGVTASHIPAEEHNVCILSDDQISVYFTGFGMVTTINKYS